MKVLQLNCTDIRGGASRAAYRIHHCLRIHGIDSCMWVNKAFSDDWTVYAPTEKMIKVAIIVRNQIGKQIRDVLKTNNSVLHSPALLSSHWLKRINKSDANLVHLHWVANEMLSIVDIGRIIKPAVWTLHDMWAFCGAEHYTEDFRWREAYVRANRPAYESGFDLNRWVWERKRKYWKKPLHIVTPSHWLGQCVKESALMKGWPVTVIPNAIDTDSWAPVDQKTARLLLGLPLDVPLVLFGAIEGGRQSIKGFDLLLLALRHLAEDRKDLQLVIFGESAPRAPLSLSFPAHYMGHLHDDLSLRLLYSAANVMVIPSRRDNLPNTGVEALSCGTPVVAFDTCGLPDIVQHKITGYLAQAFDTEDLASGIEWVLTDQARQYALSLAAREYAVEHFSYPTVARQYLAVYEQIF